MVRASASQSVDLGFNPLVESYQTIIKMVSTASLLGTPHLGEVVENKPACLLVVSLSKALSRTPPPLWKTSGADTSQIAIPMRVQMLCPKYSNTICFLVNGG